MKRGTWILKFLLFGLVMLAAIGLVTQYLWNWLVPALFAGPAITFWQALGLLVLSKILFWSFGKGGYGWRGRGMRGRWAARWDSMSLEDKERLRQKMKDKWCYRAPAESEPTGANPTSQQS
ncbi:MAG: hypothetical protein SH819_04180 [Cytophagales bacterium]|nr:hypothetical protein [Cytophagales bacterium]